MVDDNCMKDSTTLREYVDWFNSEMSLSRRKLTAFGETNVIEARKYSRVPLPMFFDSRDVNTADFCIVGFAMFVTRYPVFALILEYLIQHHGGDLAGKEITFDDAVRFAKRVTLIKFHGTLPKHIKQAFSKLSILRFGQCYSGSFRFHQKVPISKSALMVLVEFEMRNAFVGYVDLMSIRGSVIGQFLDCSCIELLANAGSKLGGYDLQLIGQRFMAFRESCDA